MSALWWCQTDLLQQCDGVRLTMSDRFVTAGHTAPRLKPVPDKGWLSPKFKTYVHCTNVVVQKTHWQKSKVKKSKLVSHQQKKNLQISKLKEASQAWNRVELMWFLGCATGLTKTNLSPMLARYMVCVIWYLGRAIYIWSVCFLSSTLASDFLSRPHTLFCHLDTPSSSRAATYTRIQKKR